jgi:hypothetical protein
MLADGATIEPHFAITGMWDFDNPGTLSVGGLTAGGDDLHALVRAGILAQSARGASFRVVGTYDGIGSDFDAFGGQVWLNIPLR